MRIIAGGRHSGKTIKLIEESARRGGYIVCRSRQEAVRIVEQAERMGYDIPFPLTFKDFIQENYYFPGVQPLHIDDADLLLTMLSKAPVATMAFTVEDTP